MANNGPYGVRKLHGPRPLRKIPQQPRAMHAKVHVGPIHSPVAGRTDHLPMHVPAGAYVVPADIVSGMGEGNSMAGFKVAKSIFTAPFYGSGTPYGEKGLPYGAAAPHKADGGSLPPGDPVPIVAAGGEYVVAPEDVVHVGGGSLDDGHAVLDEFVKGYRQHLIQTLRKLPGPRKD